MGDVVIVRFAQFALRKYIEIDSGTNETALLQWSIRDGHPRVEVFTGNVDLRTTPDYSKMIKGALDYITLAVIFNSAREIIIGDDDKKYVYNCYNAEFVDGERTGNTILQARITIGKDKAGVIYMSVTEDNKKKIKFDILPNKWIKYFDTEGVEITDKRKLSRMYAMEYFNLLQKCMDEQAIKDMAMDRKRPKQIVPKKPYQQADNVIPTDSTNYSDLDITIDDISNEDFDI